MREVIDYTVAYPGEEVTILVAEELEVLARRKH